MMKNRTFQFIVALLSSFVLALAFVLLVDRIPSVRADPDVLYVAPGGNCGGVPRCYGSVQAAVDAAAPGNEIRVAAGTYTDVHVRPCNDITITGVITQVVYITETLTVRGGYTTTNWTVPDSEANPTTLDAQWRGRGLYIAGDISPTIEGLRITRGDAMGLGGAAGPMGQSVDAGGGVYVISATATISNCWVFSNTAPAGGGLLLYSSDATVSANTVISNTASFFGGGLLAFGSDVTLNGNTIASNTSGEGGGVAVISGNALLNGNIVISNAVDKSGGGLSFDGRCDATLVNTVVAENWAGLNGAALHVRDSSINLLHTTIVHNTSGDGSGIHLHRELSLYTTAALTNTILVSHTVGIRADESTTATLHATLWHANGTNWSGNVFHTNDYTSSPAFAADGYHLTTNSAAIDLGIEAGVDDDLDGDSRPIGRPDLGADEWGTRVYLPLGLRNYP
jgi:hypothetical protein